MKHATNEMLNRICDALGLPKNVSAITLLAKVGHVPTLIVEQRVTREQAITLGVEFERVEYSLVEKQRAVGE